MVANVVRILPLGGEGLQVEVQLGTEPDREVAVVSDVVAGDRVDEDHQVSGSTPARGDNKTNGLSPFGSAHCLVSDQKVTTRRDFVLRCPR